MSENLRVACPGCNLIYDLPAEFAGQAGECTECGAIFIIPAPQPVSSPQAAPAPTPSPTETAKSIPPQAVPQAAEKIDPADVDGGPTHTVKLSRASIGMLPDVNDQFKVDVVKNNDTDKMKSANYQQPGSNKMTNTKVKKTITNIKPKAKFTPVPKPTKKWWQFWK